MVKVLLLVRRDILTRTQGTMVWLGAGGGAHHRCSSARLKAPQPGHVDGSARAAVGVGRGAVERGEVISGVDDHEVFIAVAEGRDDVEEDLEQVQALPRHAGRREDGRYAAQEDTPRDGEPPC